MAKLREGIENETLDYKARPRLNKNKNQILKYIYKLREGIEYETLDYMGAPASAPARFCGEWVGVFAVRGLG